MDLKFGRTMNYDHQNTGRRGVARTGQTPCSGEPRNPWQRETERGEDVPANKSFREGFPSDEPPIFLSTTDVASLLTPAANSRAPARSALTGPRLRRIPLTAFPGSDSLLVERSGCRDGLLQCISDGLPRPPQSGSEVQCANFGSGNSLP
jgi:hypothetical protein